MNRRLRAATLTCLIGVGSVIVPGLSTAPAFAATEETGSEIIVPPRGSPFEALGITPPTEPGNAADDYIQAIRSVTARLEALGIPYLNQRAKALPLKPDEVQAIIQGSRKQTCAFTPTYYPLDLLPATYEDLHHAFVVTTLVRSLREYGTSLETQGKLEDAQHLYERLVIFGWHLEQENYSVTQSMQGSWSQDMGCAALEQLATKRSRAAPGYEVYCEKVQVRERILATKHDLMQTNKETALAILQHDKEPMWRRAAVGYVDLLETKEASRPVLEQVVRQDPDASVRAAAQHYLQPAQPPPSPPPVTPGPQGSTAAPSLRPVTLWLKNGNHVEGEVLAEDAAQVELRIEGGTATFTRAEIASMQDTPKSAQPAAAVAPPTRSKVHSTTWSGALKDILHPYIQLYLPEHVSLRVHRAHSQEELRKEMDQDRDIKLVSDSERFHLLYSFESDWGIIPNVIIGFIVSFLIGIPPLWLVLTLLGNRPRLLWLTEFEGFVYAFGWVLNFLVREHLLPSNQSPVMVILYIVAVVFILLLPFMWRFRLGFFKGVLALALTLILRGFIILGLSRIF